MEKSTLTDKHDGILLDTCCIMNLYASGKMIEIVSSINETVIIADYVIQAGPLTIHKESKQTSPDDKEVINLQPLIANKIIMGAKLESDAEMSSFITFAGKRVDDGEAMTLALAIHRHWAVATDDWTAQRILQQQHKQIQLVSTPELFKHWQETAQPKRDVLRQAIIDTEQKANYLLGRHHSLYDWWQSSKMEQP